MHVKYFYITFTNSHFLQKKYIKEIIIHWFTYTGVLILFVINSHISDVLPIALFWCLLVNLSKIQRRWLIDSLCIEDTSNQLIFSSKIIFVMCFFHRTSFSMPGWRTE